MKKILASLSLVALMGAPVYAQSEDFTAADINGDGQITYEEAATVIEGLTEDMFNAADADASGALNEDEFNALLSQTM